MITLVTLLVGAVAPLRPYLSRLHRERDGQAAVEYAVMTFYLLVGTAVAAPFIMKFAPDMLNALQIYMDGFYFTLSLPFP